MAKCNKSERCPYEHTARCNTYNPNGSRASEKAALEEALTYYQEEKATFEHAIKGKVNDYIEYRVIIQAIKALEMAINALNTQWQQ